MVWFTRLVIDVHIVTILYYIHRVTCTYVRMLYHWLALSSIHLFASFYRNMHILTFRVHYSELRLQLIVGLGTFRV